MIIALKSSDLRRCYDAGELGFATTDDVPDELDPVGQPRAVAAMHLGTAITGTGYNVFALGAAGTRTREIVAALVADRAAGAPTPADLCYVHNFAEPYRPRLLVVPAGRGAALRRDMDALLIALRAALAAAFHGEQYRGRRDAIDEEVKARPAGLVRPLAERAQREGLALLATPMGLGFVPARDEKPLSKEEVDRLPEEERKRLHDRMHALQEELEAVLRQVPSWARERRAKIRELDRQFVRDAVGQLVDEVRRKYDTLEAVGAYLDAVQTDLIENARQLLRAELGAPAEPGETLGEGAGHRGALRRYQVNLLVDNSEVRGAPVVTEDNPTYDNLVGHIDHVSHLGTLVTDFTLIRPGALHRANGGFLVLEALHVLRAPYAWEALKLALRSRRLRVVPLAHQLGFGGGISLDPEALPLDVRVVVTGEPLLFYLLSAYDADFERLFKVAADFAEEIEATEEDRSRYVRLLATLARREHLLPFEAAAVARLLEESARLAGTRNQLSMRTERVVDLMREADHLARAGAAAHVTAQHVGQAVDARNYRSDRLRQRFIDDTRRGMIMIDLAGAKIGQANGLSIVLLGDCTFGRPNRITARVRVGHGNVVDIEREVELGGPIHTKGVLILAAFLSGRYALDAPLSLHASLVFEQSYTAVEGDSASAAELFALLSAIANVPLKQGIAITGAVNQLGEVQPVGGINEKIEGFFDACRAGGLTGEQGVLIPHANVQSLMLRQDVVDAVEGGRFHVYTMKAIDDGIELLTGMPAANRDESGEFPPGSFDQLIELRLQEFAERRRLFEAPITAEIVSPPAVKEGVAP